MRISRRSLLAGAVSALVMPRLPVPARRGIAYAPIYTDDCWYEAFGTVLKRAEVQKIEGWIADCYGVELPIAHPFRRFEQ